MSQVKISRNEIEKMLKDQLDCKNISWDKDGNCKVNIDFEDLKKKEIIREPYIIPYRPWLDREIWCGVKWTVNTKDNTMSYVTAK